MLRSTRGEAGGGAIGGIIALAVLVAPGTPSATAADTGRPAAEEPLRLVRAVGGDVDDLMLRLDAEGVDTSCGATVTATGIEFVVSPRELDRLRAVGFEIEEIARGRPFRDILAERAALDGGVPPGYLDLTQVIAEMMQAAAAHPGICQFVDLTTRYGTPPTFEGRNMHAVRISDNVTADEDEPTALFVSCHHSRELVTPVIALVAIEQLTTLYGVDPSITALVDEYELWIAPVWNPDGYNHVFNGDNFWRKNRRVFGPEIGVDLNRNYPFGWGSPCSGSNLVGSQTYRGPSPASESETQTMIALAEDRHFAKLFDYHSFGREVRYGYGCWNHPLLSFLIAEATDLASVVPGYGTGSSCCTAGDIHYHSANNGTHAFLWETQTEFQPPFSEAETEAALLFPAITSFLERPLSVSGHVTDAATGLPVDAMVENLDVAWEHGEINRSGGPFGRYHTTLPAGQYRLEFSADGYESQVHTVDVTAGSALVLEVALVGPCLADVNGDNTVNVLDLLAVLTAWGPCPACPEDVNGDGTVDVLDLLEVLSAWGPCP